MKKLNKENDSYLILIILTVFLALAVGTRFHDPYLHGLIIYLNGWQIGDYTSGLTTGSTEAFYSATKNISTLSVWIFYMFPAIFIYILVMFITFFKSDKIILISGIILTGLNLPSFDPSNKGSDSYEAVMFLLTRGLNEILVFALHWIIFILIIIIWALYLDIAVENDTRDARSRILNILRFGKK